MKPLHRLLSYTKPYWKMLLLSLVAAALFGAISTVPMYVLKHTVDEVFINRYSHLVIPFILAFIGIFLVKELFMYLSGYTMHWVNNRVVNDIRNDLFSKIINHPLSFFQSTSTGTLISHFINDVQMVQLAAAAAIRDGVRSFFEALGLVGFALTQNWKLGVLMLMIGPFLAMVIKKLGRVRKAASVSIQMQQGTVSSMLQESFIGVREIKAFNAEAVETSRFTSLLNRCFSAIMLNVHVECILPALVEAIAISGCGVIFYVAANQVLDGTITAGQLTAFVASVVLSYQPLKKVVNVYSDVQYGLAAAERVFAIMDTVYPAAYNRTVTVSTFQKDIVLDHVSFGYTQQPVFSNANLTMHKGQTIGIVGPSGSGKSTFCDLLLGFVTPSQGVLRIDGVDSATITLKSLRNQIGYVGQRTFLFNDTIAHNVAYARPDATRDEIVAACKTAHAHEFIDKLPDGYDTIVGENGTLLSGGQKQRLTIARALLKDPAILIFDEATSALDEESEQMIRMAMEELHGEKTLLIVSHRPTMLHNVDRMFFINNGIIQEIAPSAMNSYFTRAPF